MIAREGGFVKKFSRQNPLREAQQAEARARTGVVSILLRNACLVPLFLNPNWTNGVN